MNLTQTDDDTLLSAYIDGELPADAAERLESRLADEPSLAARLQAMRAANDTARDLFRAVDEQPMPDAVMRMLANAQDAKPDNVLPFPGRVIRRFAQMPVAIAASVALVAGFLISDVLDEVPDVSGISDLAVAGRVAPDSALFEALETGRSGVPLPLSAAATAEVLLTFEDRSGDFCRQIRVDLPPRRANGLACRRDGDWQFEALAYTAAATPGTGFTPASDPSLAALDAVLDGLLGDGEILDSDEENTLISNTWKKTSE